jgi:hypothetical protein
MSWFNDHKVMYYMINMVVLDCYESFNYLDNGAPSMM